jgi:hypothetical protein
MVWSYNTTADTNMALPLKLQQQRFSYQSSAALQPSQPAATNHQLAATTFFYKHRTTYKAGVLLS